MKNTFYKVKTLYSGKAVVQDCFVGVGDGKITYVGHEKPADCENFREFKDQVMIPGMIDVHTHGYAGCDVLKFGDDEEEIKRFNSIKLKQGVTTYLPTCSTAELVTYEKVLSAVDRHIKNVQHTPVLGVNMEGPYISSHLAGAQNKDAILNFSDRSAVYLIKCYLSIVKIITIAPELAEACNYISDLSKMMVVSIGHTGADSAKAAAAFSNGARLATHLFNAMSPMTHRELGVSGAALSNDAVYTEVICDGFHIVPDLVKLIFRMKPLDKVILITDSVDAAGGATGEYQFAGLPVVYDGERVVLKDGGNLAGSALTLDRALRNAVRFTGRSIEEILPAVTLNPAKLLGIDEYKGSLENGKDADFVILDEELKVQKVYTYGNCAYENN